ncbi:hypothetical protein ACFSBZ_10815 [Amnibacterium flavum]|uniref:Uncharacterized protein n=1 Tax=Amnibacterium flavum TaxID=2173173 RepID=A0A2V1HRV4_9MICO|nr:hypothetical protein [Amnibacterium flavum]PVZ95325.1 hypothetical protein DDQ50_02040 [Amnibacterium flavum]
MTLYLSAHDAAPTVVPSQGRPIRAAVRGDSAAVSRLLEELSDLRWKSPALADRLTRDLVESRAAYLAGEITGPELESELRGLKRIMAGATMGG